MEQFDLALYCLHTIKIQSVVKAKTLSASDDIRLHFQHAVKSLYYRKVGMLFCGNMLLIFFQKNLPGIPSVSNSLDSDKARRYVWPNLGPN